MPDWSRDPSPSDPWFVCSDCGYMYTLAEVRIVSGFIILPDHPDVFEGGHECDGIARVPTEEEIADEVERREGIPSREPSLSESSSRGVTPRKKPRPR